jgi:hypothetical protein
LNSSIKYLGAPDIQMIYNRERFIPEGYFSKSIVQESTISNQQFDAKSPTFMDWHIVKNTLEDEVGMLDPFWD